MSKIAVIYWSGTGNTEAMADLVANAAAAAGASYLNARNFSSLFTFGIRFNA